MEVEETLQTKHSAYTKAGDKTSNRTKRRGIEHLTLFSTLLQHFHENQTCFRSHAVSLYK